ncbi:hypothetical protein FHS85_005319 [Rhodoligotrophos appendicifer]|uniref:hypothetical protein n=1 Tax=Rhodoligotrophos appendicifer TaxID=987056 RepID=UPI001184FB79|nr:hypothetical protein [Rhodoligotrophos appendicifer]
MRKTFFVLRQDAGWVVKQQEALSRIYGMQSFAEAEAVKAAKEALRPGEEAEVLVERGGGQWRTAWSSSAQAAE